MPIQETLHERFTATYGGIPPAIWTIITQLIQSLLGGCTGKSVKAHYEANPTRLRRRILWEAVWMTGDMAEARKIADATLNVIGQSSEVEIDELAAAKTVEI